MFNIRATLVGVALSCLTLVAACTQTKQDAIAQSTPSSSPATASTPAIA